MALNFPRQIVTTRSPVIAGGVPPSGNFPVFSPFAGGFRPLQNHNSRLIGNAPRVGSKVGLHLTPKGQPILSGYKGSRGNMSGIGGGY